MGNPVVRNFYGDVPLLKAQIEIEYQNGDTITLRFGEVLFPNGSLMTENLRKARAKDTYILKGNPEGETWSPRFTYHGFQYVEVSGFRSTPSLDAITGLVLSSATGWSESGIVCPYTIYKTYGDTKMIRQFWPNMLAYLKFMETKTKETFVYKEGSFEDITPMAPDDLLLMHLLMAMATDMLMVNSGLMVILKQLMPTLYT